MNSTEPYRLRFPSQMIIEENLKENTTAAYLRSEEKIIKAVAAHFSNKDISFSEIQTRITACLAGEEQSNTGYKLAIWLKHKETIEEAIIQDIASALMDCANLHNWYSSRL